MTKIKVTGVNRFDVLQALGGLKNRPDISLNFRSEDFGAKKLRGLLIEFPKNRYKNREFAKLDDAISYIRKLYREHHGR